MIKAVDWMLSKEVRHKGDWAVKVPNTEPGGWYFEFNNEFYPDTDDTAQVLLALNKVDNPRERYQHEVAAARHRVGVRHAVPQRRLGQLRQRQHQDDLPVHPLRRSQRHARSAHGRHYRDACWRCWPPTATPATTSASQKAIKFIFGEQEPDGSWFGRWGVNYIYGTFLVLRGLEAIGIDHLEPQIQQAAEWIRMVQNPDGGWGETCGSYDDPNTRGIGPSTPSQTAWAMLGLLAAGDDRSDSVAKGVRWLLDSPAPRRQLGRIHGRRPTRQAIITGTGFPRFFIWPTPCTGNISRCWRLPATSGPWNAPIAHAASSR